MKIFSINSKVLFYKEYCNNTPTGIIFGNLNGFSKFLRFLCGKLLPPLYSLFYTKDFRNCGASETTIVIFDSNLTRRAANYVKHRYPNLRVIYWFWNHIYDPSILNELDDEVELWTYDAIDAAKYNLKMNTQFFFPELVCETEQYHTNFDCIFVGSDKGRYKILEKTKKELEDRFLKTFFLIAETGRFKNDKNRLSYYDVLSRVKASKCVIDILPEEQTGLSLRPLEALFFNKKLITNFKYIKKYPFYSPFRIFILGEDNINDIKKFMDSDLDFTYESKYKDYYSFRNWLHRFL